MCKRIADVLIGSFLIALILTPAISSARIYLFDKKLEINGSIEQKANWKYTLKDWERGRGKHNPNGLYSNGGRYPSRGTPTMFKTHLHLEGLYHAFNDGEKLLDVFGLFEWFYDWGPQMTGSYGRGMRSRDSQAFRTNMSSFEDVVRELYFNYVSGPWTLRLGKQMVVWGETSLQRTADVVNPVDLRSHMMGVDDWEDFKRGLWMFRGFYQTSFTNDLTFELIWVPADVKGVQPAAEGTMYNTTYTGGFTSQLFQHWDKDQVKEAGLSDSQGGFRLRGFNWDWDWTFIYYNGYDPGPVVVDWGQHGLSTYSPQSPAGFALARNGAAGFNLWAGEYNINALNGDTLKRTRVRFFEYKRVNNIGATATRYIYKLPVFGLFEIPLKANVRFEAAYKPNVTFNRGEFDPSGNTWAVTGLAKRDVLGYALEIGKDFMPQFICKYNGQRSVDVTFGLYQDWILGASRRVFRDGYGRGGNNKDSTSFSLDITTDWFKQEVMTKLNMSYNTQNYGNIWAFIQYAPGVHWRFTLLPRYTWSNRGSWNNHGDTPAYRGYTEYSDSNNYIHFKVGYLF